MAQEQEGIDPEVEPSGTGCVECLAAQGWWVHLRRCAQCGHIGCCDSSPAQHATHHFEETGHPVMTSFEPGEDWFWDFTPGPGLPRTAAGRPAEPPRGPAHARPRGTGPGRLAEPDPPVAEPCPRGPPSGSTLRMTSHTGGRSGYLPPCTAPPAAGTVETWPSTLELIPPTALTAPLRPVTARGRLARRAPGEDAAGGGPPSCS